MKKTEKLLVRNDRRMTSGILIKERKKVKVRMKIK